MTFWPEATIPRAVYLLWLLCIPAVGADTIEPLRTASELAARLGQQAVVEFTVVEVKHPQRRKAIFLTSSANFRGPESLAVMIRDEDLPQFKVNDEKVFSHQYVGRGIRVNGEVARDEGQLVIRIASPDQIQIAAASHPAPTKPRELVLTKGNGQLLRLTADELSQLQHVDCQVEHEGKHQTYSGVSLAAVLKHGGVVLGEESRGRLLNRFVLVRAADGYQALLSVAEVDPYFRPQTILLANSCDGQPLDATEGPWRLVVKDDRHHRRWVRSVVAIIVRDAAEAGASEHLPPQ